MHGAETVARGLLCVRCDGGKGQDGSGKKDAGLHRLLARYREFDGGRFTTRPISYVYHGGVLDEIQNQASSCLRSDGPGGRD